MGATPSDGRVCSAPADLVPTWWSRHRDLALYVATGVVVAALGLLWNGALSMILTPVWMLAGVWLIPARIEHLLRRRR